MNDYIPFMDLHPELNLVPATSYDLNVKNFQNRFDYVQDIKRKDADGNEEIFHLVVKDGKFGVLMHVAGLFSDTDRIALPAEYDSVQFLYKRGKAFGAIVEKKGKFGLFFWEYFSMFYINEYSVPAEYESMQPLGNMRIKGIKDNSITYFNETGHVLK